MDLSEYGCTGCVLGGADRHGGALSDVETTTSPTNHALNLGVWAIGSFHQTEDRFSLKPPVLGESARNDYLTIGDELGGRQKQRRTV